MGKTAATVLLLAITSASPALAGDGSWHPGSLWESLLASAAFGLLGIVLAILGFKLFDLAIPFDLEKEICQNKNIAVGILCGSIVLGICWIISASMS